jgi:hypothetical protein
VEPNLEQRSAVINVADYQRSAKLGYVACVDRLVRKEPYHWSTIKQFLLAEGPTDHRMVPIVSDNFAFEDGDPFFGELLIQLMGTAKEVLGVALDSIPAGGYLAHVRR